MDEIKAEWFGIGDLRRFVLKEMNLLLYELEEID